MASTFDALLDEALKLPDEERGELASRLLRSLEPVNREVASTQEWEAQWSAELDRRVREIRDGSVELVDGNDVLAELRDIAERP
jgi:putative addiction module component (TIGR02574 family)